MKWLFTPILLGFISGGLWLTSCSSESSDTTEVTQETVAEETELQSEEIAQAENIVPYTVAQRYFASIEVEEITEKAITTSREFYNTFGTITGMGTGEQPTSVDFEKQFVISIIAPETSIETVIEIKSLTKTEEGKLLCTYKVTEGGQLRSFIRPFAILIVDNTEGKEVLFQRL